MSNLGYWIGEPNYDRMWEEYCADMERRYRQSEERYFDQFIDDEPLVSICPVCHCTSNRCYAYMHSQTRELVLWNCYCGVCCNSWQQEPNGSVIRRDPTDLTDIPF
jgi:hypothetical protein